MQSILDLLYGAKKPVILADACSIRHHAVKETHELMETLGIPGFVTPMGKGAIDETNPYFGGVYIGEISLPNVRKTVEESDCVLSIGALLSDFNTVRVSGFQTNNRVLSVIISESHEPLNFTHHGQRYATKNV